MIAPLFPLNEKQRIDALKSYNLLDTLPEKDFENITTLVANICEVPISLVTLLDSDRNFLKSHYGIPFNESPRDISFCGHAILDNSEIFIVEDSREDMRFKDNPLVSENGAIFYAGVPLINDDNYALGTLCVFDTKPRTLSQTQKNTLIALGKQVMNLFEARKQNKILNELQIELKTRNEELKNYAGIISHDMKMPLANIILTTDILRKKYAANLDDEAMRYLNYLKDSSFTLSDYITGLLNHYESDKLMARSEEAFDIHELLEGIIDLLNINIDCEINIPEFNVEMNCNKIALEQIFLNLLGNSIKYNNKEQIIISIDCSQDDDFYIFSITDNGVGIPKGKMDSIFALFTTLDNKDRNGNKGNGIGLSTVKKLVTGLGGEITVASKLDSGSIFKFTIKKNNC